MCYDKLALMYRGEQFSEPASIRLAALGDTPWLTDEVLFSSLRLSLIRRPRQKPYRKLSPQQTFVAGLYGYIRDSDVSRNSREPDGWGSGFRTAALTRRQLRKGPL